MRLIDADKLAEEVKAFSCWVTGWNEHPKLCREVLSQQKKSILELIDEAPTMLEVSSKTTSLDGSKRFIP